jgi:hypothetical protein
VDAVCLLPMLDAAPPDTRPAATPPVAAPRSPATIAPTPILVPVPVRGPVSFTVAAPRRHPILGPPESSLVTNRPR